MEMRTSADDHLQEILLLIAIVGAAIGQLWMRRIASMDEDPDRSCSRMTAPRGMGRFRLPLIPADLPPSGWLFTRGAIVLGLAASVFATLGPIALWRWDSAVNVGGLAAVAWLAAIGAAVTGTGWMVRIAYRGPEAGAPPWRYRR